MGRSPRQYRPDLVYEVTSNTFANHHYLRPCAKSTEIYIGVVARALERYSWVRLHALNPISTHSTEMISSRVPEQIPLYLCFVKTNLATELSDLHGLDLKFWENRRARAIPIAPDPASLEHRFRYCLSQGTKEDLVLTPYEWPGVTGVHSLTEGRPLEGVWFDRTAEGEARARGEDVDPYDYATPYSMQMSPLPHWAHMDEDEWRPLAKEIIDDIGADAQKRRGDNVLGAEAVMAVPPTYRGSGPKRSPAPVCHGIGKAFAVLRKVINEFCAAFVAASDSERNGDGSIPYPPYAIPAARKMTPGDGDVFDPLGMLAEAVGGT